MTREAPRCPISGEAVDERAARTNAGVVVVLLLLSTITDAAPLILAYLAADFALKVFAGFAYSPNCAIARTLVTLVRVPARMVDASPKRFAAVMGLLMSTAALFAELAGAGVLGRAIVAVFAVCAALEAFAGVCVGCYIYGLLPGAVSRVFVRRAARGASDG